MSKRILLPEWAEQDGVMLTWPHSEGYWGEHLARVEKNFVEIAYHISCHERVLINCHNKSIQDQVSTALQERGADMQRILTHIVPNNDVWARDHGPISVREDGSLRLLDFRFNGWGGKYPAQRDNAITLHLVDDGILNREQHEQIDFILEGGAIDYDGNGSLLTTSSCVLNKNRNPAYDPQQIETLLCRTLGVERILWINNGQLEGDDTDGHIDTLARFCSADTIAYVTCRNTRDALYPSLHAMESELVALINRDGKPYKLLPLALPDPIRNKHGVRLPATYANFLIINNAVLVPTYNDKADQQALDTIKQAFPDRKVVGIDCVALIHQYGSLHCVTMQLPKGCLQPM